MKRTLKVLKNPFSLSGTSPEDIRLASAPVPPRPPAGYTQQKPRVRLAMAESSEEDIERRLNEALEKPGSPSETEASKQDAVKHAFKDIDKVLEHSREGLSSERLDEGATGEEMHTHAQDVERTDQALGEAAGQARQEVGSLIPNDEEEPVVSPLPTAPEAPSTEGVDEEEPIPIMSAEEAARVHDVAGLEGTPAQKKRDEEKEAEIDIEEVPAPGGGTEQVQVLQRDEKGKPTKVFRMEAEVPEEHPEADRAHEKEPSSKSESAPEATLRRTAPERSTASAGRERPEQFELPWWERWFPNLSARMYELGVERARAPMMKARDLLEQQRDQTQRMEDTYARHQENLNPIRATYYKWCLERSRGKERAYEAQMRKFHGVMSERSENIKRILRGTERKYRSELRPHEVRADAEKARLDGLRSLNEELSDSLEYASEELVGLEEEGRGRKSLRRSREFAEARREVRERLRSIGRRLRNNEIEISRRNARFVEANANADLWRDRINDLAERTKGSELEFDIPDPEEMRVSGFGSLPDYEVQRSAKEAEAGSTPEEIDTEEHEGLAVDEQFVEFWNQLTGRESEKIEHEGFMERLREQLADQGKDEFDEASDREIETVVKQLLSEQGVVRGPSWWKGKVARILRLIRNE